MIVVWEEEVTRVIRPRMFTREAWAALTPSQRDMIRRQRMAVVTRMRAEHEERYHHGDRRIDDLAQALDE